MFTWIVYNSSLNVITKARVFQGGVGKDGVKLGQAAFHIPSPEHIYGNQLRGVKRGGFALHYCNLRLNNLNASQTEKLEYFRPRYSKILCMPLMIDYPIPYVRCASHEKRFSFIEAKTTVFPDIRWVFTRFLRFSGWNYDTNLCRASCSIYFICLIFGNALTDIGRILFQLPELYWSDKL